jgi:hypothetical protein
MSSLNNLSRVLNTVCLPTRDLTIGKAKIMSELSIDNVLQDALFDFLQVIVEMDAPEVPDMSIQDD